MARRAVFFDRDGTLIKIVHRPEDPKKQLTAPFVWSELEFVPEADKVLRWCGDNGFLRIMITNQPDVALGHLPSDTWQQIHNTVIGWLSLDDYFMCRHRSEDNCSFKKPSPMMLLAAADKWDIDLSQSYMVGDTDKDAGAGKAAGCTTILIDRFYNTGVEADIHVPNLEDVVKYIR